MSAVPLIENVPTDNQQTNVPDMGSPVPDTQAQPETYYSTPSVPAGDPMYQQIENPQPSPPVSQVQPLPNVPISPANDNSGNTLQAVTTPTAQVTTQVPVAVIPAKFWLKSKTLNFNAILVILFSLQYFLQQFTDLKVVSLLFPASLDAVRAGNILSAAILVVGDIIAVVNFTLRIVTNQPVTFTS